MKNFPSEGKTDAIRIDSHKLMYHIPRLHQWLQGKNIYPIYVEVSLYGGCNHRCIFCAFNFLKYKLDMLDKKCLERFIAEAAAKGVKSILYSGEGEPLLHKDAVDIIIATKKAGIDVALSTNGVMFDREKAVKTLRCLTWLKFSLDAAREDTYALIHGTKKEDFKRVLRNISDAVRVRDKKGYECTIGAQYLLLPQNYRETLTAAEILSDIGVDYLVIKPYSRHPSAANKIKPEPDYKKLFYLQERLNSFSKGKFQVIFRRHAMEKMGEDKAYKRCLGTPFATYIKANGDVCPCSLFLDEQEFTFGNICRESFKNIWEGERRARVVDAICGKWDITRCRKSCRLDEINRYLWELKNPVSHVNFI